MPELPEVETVARGLSYLSGRRLGALEILDARVWFESELEPESLSGLQLKEVSRRGKYLLLRFEGGLTLVQHLRMTGKMLEARSELVPREVIDFAPLRRGKGLQVRCRFQFHGAEIWFFDPRRFGTLTLVRDEEKFFVAKGIAPDPILEPVRALAWFLEKMAATGKPAKAALLDQQIVAGVGNIYADEALHGAGIDPRIPASRIHEPLLLWEHILRLLEDSIRHGGSTIRDYVSAAGRAGTFADRLLVYDRAGEPCGQCGERIKRIVLGGRSTHFCSRCQPRKPPSLKARKGKSARSKAARSAGTPRRSRRRALRRS